MHVKMCNKAFVISAAIQLQNKSNLVEGGLARPQVRLSPCLVVVLAPVVAEKFAQLRSTTH